jgi:hypothetical protein
MHVQATSQTASQLLNDSQGWLGGWDVVLGVVVFVQLL